MMATTPTTPVAERDGHMAEISNPELIVFCVYRCGGVGRFIEIEDVYEEAFKVAPSRFGWRSEALETVERAATPAVALQARHTAVFHARAPPLATI